MKKNFFGRFCLHFGILASQVFEPSCKEKQHFTKRISKYVVFNPSCKARNNTMNQMIQHRISAGEYIVFKGNGTQVTNDHSVMLNLIQHRTGDDEDIASKVLETLKQVQGDGLDIGRCSTNNQPTLAQQPFAKRISRCEVSKLKRAAFSLIELMISLITISIIAAAFTPVITKKLSASSITVGSMGSSSSSGPITGEPNSQADCDGLQALFIPKQTAEGKNICVLKYNVGDIPGMTESAQFPTSVTKVTASSTDSASSRCDASTKKCCWKGTTSTQCDSENGGYSGCTRTVCEWDAAVDMCSNLSLGGAKWRLPTGEELSTFGSYTKGKGTSGLMLCDDSSGYSSARCDFEPYCWGSYDGLCRPYRVWGEIEASSGGSDVYNYRLLQGHWGGSHDDDKLYPFSVRCVTDTINYSGYTTGGGTSSGTGGGARAFECNDENFMQIGDYCVTRRNMGDLVGFNDSELPDDIKTNKKTAAASSSSNCDTSTTKCCWDGDTATSVVEQNGSYSPQGRTICDWNAAVDICSKFNHKGLTWELPSKEFASDWTSDALSPLKGDLGLMLCTHYESSTKSAICRGPARCYGELDNTCRPYNIWTSTTSSDANAYIYNYGTTWDALARSKKYSGGVRCIAYNPPVGDSGGGGGGGSISGDFEESTGDCKLSFGSYCLYCALQDCAEGEYIDTHSCSCKSCAERFGENCTACSQTQCLDCASGFELTDAATTTACSEGTDFVCPNDENFMEITYNEGSEDEYHLCVTRRNMGDLVGITPQIPDTVIEKTASTTDSASSRCDTESNKCCWKGATTSNCGLGNSTQYSGCKRVLCDWDAGVEICKKFNYGGASWRLPTLEELTYLGNFARYKGDSGVLFCDGWAGYNSPICNGQKACWGSVSDYCYPWYIWSGTEYSSDTSKARSHYLNEGVYSSPQATSKIYAFSVRCVTKTKFSSSIPSAGITTTCTLYSSDCELCTGEKCLICGKNCAEDEYLDDEACACKSCSSFDANCVSCNSEKCEMCQEGYYLNNGVCETCPEGYFCDGSKYKTQCIAKYGANCTTCTPAECTSCTDGYMIAEAATNQACKPKFTCPNDQNFMEIVYNSGTANEYTLCVTRRNMGDLVGVTGQIPSTVTKVNPGGTCDGTTYKCCFVGNTSGSSCNEANGSYSGCNRSLCNYSAASEICSKFKYNGVDWRLPTSDEVRNWDTYTKNLGNNGLQICSGETVSGYTLCGHIGSCYGSYSNMCYAYYLYTKENSTAIRWQLINAGWIYTGSGATQMASSVRCVVAYDGNGHLL